SSDVCSSDLITVDGADYTGQVGGAGRRGSVVPGSDLVADADKTIEARITTTDAAGNTGSASTSGSYTVDTTDPVPTISLDAIAGDNIVNAAEAGGTVAISGTVGGEFNAGDTVTITVDGADYTGQVDASGRFSIDVPGSDLVADADKTIEARITTTDAAGNTGSASTSGSYTVDTTDPRSAERRVGKEGENRGNAAEAGGTVAISGTVGGEFNAGDTVTITVGGADCAGQVDPSGGCSSDVPGSGLHADADKTIEARITTTDAAGNTGSASTSGSYTVDTTDP